MFTAGRRNLVLSSGGKTRDELLRKFNYASKEHTSYLHALVKRTRTYGYGVRIYRYTVDHYKTYGNFTLFYSALLLYYESVIAYFVLYARLYSEPNGRISWKHLSLGRKKLDRADVRDEIRNRLGYKLFSRVYTRRVEARLKTLYFRINCVRVLIY